jgi:multidrug efflux pump
MATIHKTDAEYIAGHHNTSRFFVEHRQVGWVLLIATLIWGIYGYQSMPKRKDPNIPVRVAVAYCPWPGVDAQQVEQLVTKQIESTIAGNTYIKAPVPGDYGIKSLTFPGLAIVYVQLADTLEDTREQFSDINLKLNNLNSSLPSGAGPIQLNSDFGQTAALMLTVASPPVGEVELSLRARDVKQAILKTRKGDTGSRLSIVYCFPASVPPGLVLQPFGIFAKLAEKDGVIRDIRYFSGIGYAGIDGVSTYDDAKILEYGQNFVQERLHESEIHPDAWAPAIIRSPDDTLVRLSAVAGEKYSYVDLDNFTDLISRTVLGAPEVSKADRSGVLSQQVYLDYSQERLAAYGVKPAGLKNVLQARNIALPGGTLEIGTKEINIDPSGQFESAQAIGDVIVGFSSTGVPLYLRDLVQINRGYQSPPQFLNYYGSRDAEGKWHRSRAVTIAFQMRQGDQIGAFAKSVDQKLDAVRQLLPPDLILARTSDQPRQVEENVDLFMDALYEAILLVVLVSLIGFWEWRSALLMAISIPITLAMTFGFADMLGIDLQQVSIATLIIALGLLVDDPVVAGDAIKRDLAEGQPPINASWLGPTKLARAIMYATVTNIAAYIPFLLLTGATGDFIYSLPIVMTCALVSSRLVSMTFIPMLSYYLLRPSKKPELTIEEKRVRGFSGFYCKVANFAIEHRWKVFIGSFAFLFLGVILFRTLPQAFFPDDVQYWSTIDIWLPNDAPLSATNKTERQVEDVIRKVAEDYGRQHPQKDGKPKQVLQRLTSFVGGGGPRFWFSCNPAMRQQNYSQVIIEVADKNDTPILTGLFQNAVSAAIPGARIDIRQLQLNPVENPLEVRIACRADVSAAQEPADIRTLRSLSRQVEEIFRKIPEAQRVRNSWDEESSTVKLVIDPDRANLAGIANSDVALSTTTAMSGYPVTTLREGDKQIQVLSRLIMEERAQLSDIQNLYVYASQGSQKVPLLQISSVENTMETQRIWRYEHFRTISILAFPAPGFLPSQALTPAMAALEKFQETIPPGYKMEIGGEYAKQESGFKNLATVMCISVLAIFIALVMQFNHAIKPFLVFAAVPYGTVGAIIALAVMHAPFGFMSFLGVASLVGVIVSHVIVLFDFIEEMHDKGEPFKQALLDAGIQRLRPVLITVGATVIALFPLAMHGGPLWQPLCYAQIGGLSVATFITLLLVPVLYSIFVLDLKIVKWEGQIEEELLKK